MHMARGAVYTHNSGFLHKEVFIDNKWGNAERVVALHK